MRRKKKTIKHNWETIPTENCKGGTILCCVKIEIELLDSDADLFSRINLKVEKAIDEIAAECDADSRQKKG